MSNATRPTKRKGRGPSKTKGATAIDPEKLYRFPYFKQVSGLTDVRIQMANRLHKIKPQTHDLGQVRYIFGRDGIEFIVRLAAAEKAAKAKAAKHPA